MASTLLTELNKSEPFIIAHATKIHTRDLHFTNNAKIYLDEDKEFPSGEANI